MAALIIETQNKKSLKLIAELAKQLGSRVKSISVDDVEDLILGQMIDEAKTGEYVSKETLMKKLAGRYCWSKSTSHSSRV